MPNKTIYVSETDLPLFDKAQQQAGGSLSAAISQALRRFVEDQEMQEQGFEEITVEVGKSSRVDKRFVKVAHIEKRFMGRLLISWRTADRENPRFERYDIFRTPKGQFAVHYKNAPNWDYSSEEEDEAEQDPSREYRLDVYQNLDEMRGRLPDELYEAAREALAESAGDGEFLDI